ncbi:hemerythrin domain-containing protein [Psychrobacter sp. AOP22-C1-22]|uniref:hemerythrin domain-containing protein n=1 Tax=unclassified Psychrobacter TaxID=196806 RepID=UPI001787D444|nr:MULTISPECIES: hemerythrin domain-containing protein [unclassified Psychrobacter]MBE0406112.1 hemerythrin domain-containing protein [Psychrobacter sp. FME6]MBE0444894.1 hemerythrin domain-containing protein [Psychrobacter sp. FME5]
MKRANQLQPLSRQHHLGLNLSRHAKECIDEPAEISKHWLNITGYLKEMEHHFRIEDNLIVDALRPYQDSKPEVASVLNTLDEQHKALHALMEEGESSESSQSNPITVTQVRELATLLYDHIRFEERELFPIVESCLTEAELDTIYEASPDSIKRSDENR